MLRKVAKALGPEGNRHGVADGLNRLRFWAAIAIVFVSVGSALAVLAAAVYDERSSHDDALYRQQLVSWQQGNRLHEEEVAEDVALFGSYEQHALHARDLRREARAFAANPRLANTLRTRAEREQAITAALFSEFRVATPLTSGRGAPSYDPSVAYRIAAGSPQALAEELSPGDHRRAARSARHDAVQMAKVAAFCLAALFMLTFAQVYAGAKAPKVRKTVKPAPERIAAPAPKPHVLRLAYTLFSAGLAFAVVAAIVGFPMVP